MEHNQALESLAGLRCHVTEMEHELSQIAHNQMGPVAESVAQAFLCTTKLHGLLWNVSGAVEHDLEQVLQRNKEVKHA